MKKDKALKAELKKIQVALGVIETNMAIMETGDHHGPYWSGKGAVRFIQSGMAYLLHTKKLLSELEKCSEYLENETK